MSGQQIKPGDKYSIALNDLQSLLDLLQKKAYRILGPTVRDGAIVIDELESVSDLPRGWTDEQDAATYRLIKREDEAHFGFVVGPQSWKKYLYPSKHRLWSATREKASIQYHPEPGDNQKMAFIGVRPCELKAIEILDKVFSSGPFRDPGYISKRTNTLIVALNCGQAGGTCFCASMGTGPKATSGFDLALTEILESGFSRFVVEVGSEKGQAFVDGIAAKKASTVDIQAAEAVSDRTAKSMGRQLELTGIKEILIRNHENPRWEATAQRCLTCGNCTMVCPTCFCTTVEDVTDLSGKQAERWQRWDSCFTMDFSYIHGGSIRPSTKARYRQYVTHKLAHWYDQFGVAGCVGCGRCITWCPAAIDITEEARVIRESERALKAAVPVLKES